MRIIKKMKDARQLRADRREAIKALDGMETIVRAEMLKRGCYVTDEVVKPERAEAICGGHKACAIGSLWLGAGVKMKIEMGSFTLPGAAHGLRASFVATRPPLRIALTALNQAVEQFVSRAEAEGRRGVFLNKIYPDAIEQLFEGCYRSREVIEWQARDYGEDPAKGVNDDDLLGIIREARTIVTVTV